jgi:hypothetical protein
MTIILLLVAGLGFSQATKQNEILIVAGHTGQAPVTQVGGRPYVAIDALMRLMRGSLEYRGNQIILTLPGATNTVVTPVKHAASRAFSRDFLNATIETMGDIREWRSALLVAVQNGYQATDAWMDPYRAKATNSLSLASVTTTTDSDRDVLELLHSELGYMQQLDNKVLAARKIQDYMTSDSIEKDPLDQKVLSCAHALGKMAAGGELEDDGSCR